MRDALANIIWEFPHRVFKTLRHWADRVLYGDESEEEGRWLNG